MTQDHRVPIEISGARKFLLSDMADELQFFSHGLLFAAGGLRDPDDDPVIHWCREHEECEYCKQVFARPLFSGIGNGAEMGGGEAPVSWDHVLCAVRHEYANSLLNYVASLVIRDKRRGRVALPQTQLATIYDPVAVDCCDILHGQLPTIDVVVFGVETNIATLRFATEGAPARRPTVVSTPASEKTKTWAAQLLQDDLSPLADRGNDAFQARYDERQKNGPIIT